MAFADPQSVTVDGTAVSLNRVFTGKPDGQFVSSDSAYKIELVSSNSKSRISRTARLYNTKTTADPLVGSVNVRVGDMVSLTINRPIDGYSDDEILKQVTGFIAWLQAGTNANLKKLIAGEN